MKKKIPLIVEVECVGTPDKKLPRMWRSWKLLKKISKRKKRYQCEMKGTGLN